MSAPEGKVVVEFVMSPGNRVEWTMPAAQWAAVSQVIGGGTGFVYCAEDGVMHALAVPHIACFRVTLPKGAR